MSVTSSEQLDAAIRIASSATIRLAKSKEAHWKAGVGEIRGELATPPPQNLTSIANGTHSGEIDVPDVEAGMDHLDRVPKEGGGPPVWLTVVLGFFFTGLSLVLCFFLNFWWNRRPWAW